MRPLDKVTVLDFSTLLPGPLAGLMLARGGARVIKIERPRTGDEMRSYQPRFGDFSVNFALTSGIAALRRWPAATSGAEGRFPC